MGINSFAFLNNYLVLFFYIPQKDTRATRMPESSRLTKRVLAFQTAMGVLLGDLKVVPAV
jgi:hypothetical protein